MMEDVERFFIEEFQWIDDIAEDVVERDRIVMEARASLLIEANCTGGRWPNFMKGGSFWKQSWRYNLPKELPEQSGMGWPCPAKFRSFIFYPGDIPTQEHCRWGQTGRWQLVLDKSLNDDLGRKEIKWFQETYRSVFQLCQLVSPYNTPEKVCRFFGQDTNAFGPLKMRERWPDIFHCADMAATEKAFVPPPGACVSEAVHVGNVLEGIVRGPLWNAIHYPLWNTSYDGWLKQVFKFRNRHGEFIMIVIKLYDPKSQAKILIPATQWMTSGSTENRLHCVPWPDKLQPLYHLDLLAKPENSVVILTDSVEIADLNQAKCPDGVVFTSFICERERYDQVDWSPLAEKEVYYLITNHSGIPLEFAALKTRELETFIAENKLEINLKFITVAVDYDNKEKHGHGGRKDFDTIDDVLRRYREQKPVVLENSVCIRDPDEIEAFYQKAEDSIHILPAQWWKDEPNNSEVRRIGESESRKRKRPPYLLRPFLLRGEASMLYASKSTGKSALALSMAASVVAETTLFHEKWWTVPKIKDDPFYATKYQYHKVLYLDFENGKEEIEQRIIDFAHPYWSANKDEQQKCRENLIIEDMTGKGDGKDYSQPENWQDIVRLLENAKQRGIGGQPVDLLVIDTISKFTRKPYTSDLKLADFINKIRSMDMAVLFLHHEGHNGEVRGWKSGLDDMYFNLRLYRETDGSESSNDKFAIKDLEDPLTLAYSCSRSSIEKNPSFAIKFHKKWQEYYRDEEPEYTQAVEERRKQELRRITEHYSSKRLEHRDIYPILGLGKTTYFDLKSDKKDR